MNSYNNILHKLSLFSRKYYTTQLIKGALLFLAFGGLFSLGVLSLEYFLWLNSTGRFILFIAFFGVIAFSLIKYIITPIVYLLRIKNGLSLKQASLLIGNHFPEVGDRLYNLLDLAEDKQRSELLLASMEQRSKNLTPVPFTKAIDVKKSLKYSKYLIIPAIVVAVIWVTGDIKSFLGSYQRVINYDIAYEPPAPFQFMLLNSNMEGMENEPFMVEVRTEGSVQPDEVFIVVEGEDLLLQKQGNVYSYTFMAPIIDTNFYFRANGVGSRTYRLKSLKAPSIQYFTAILDYPVYTERSKDTLKGTGNAIIPEGTKVEWMVEGKNTSTIKLSSADSSFTFRKTDNIFTFSKAITDDFSYQLSTSNENVTDYETLYYQLKVIKDANPAIQVQEIKDSVNTNIYYAGEASDDYGVSSLELVYNVVNQEDSKKSILLERPNSDEYQFYYTFPSGMNLEKGKTYEYYFRVTDNDALKGGKTANSRVFTTAILDKGQEKDRQLEFQQSILDNLDNTLNKFKEQEELLKEINKDQKEKNVLTFNDQNQVKEFLKKQQQQEALMQKFSKQLKETMDNSERDDKLNELLKERLERQEMEARKNEKLLEELKELADKIDKEELTQRLEELGKKQQSNKRNLEQLLELTKRYYVTEKANQLANDLEKIAAEQEELSKKKIEDKDLETDQNKLNKDFEKTVNELEELKKDNEGLKKPVALDIDSEKAESAKQDQEDALDEIKDSKGAEEDQDATQKDQKQENINKKQKSAAAKMKEMSESLRQSSAAGGGSTISEDAEMLRQILDNLVIFSFKQEALFDKLKESNNDRSYYANSVREEQQLRNLFEHVDDSLFALSMRQVELTEFVNEQITDVYYNIDRSLQSIAEGQIYQGVSYQQYVLTASNNLADFLANILSNMQQSLSQGKGSGQSKDGFQLPDIIKGQKGVGGKMESMGAKGEQAGKEGSEGKDKGKENGDKEGTGEAKEGTEGKEGEQGNNGNGEQKSGQGSNEEELSEIYEIYKEQQQIRARLEEQLENLIRTEDRELAKKLVRQMEDFENDLIQNGITKRTMDKANRIQQQLLKLENATLQQGKKEERESNTNTIDYSNPIMSRPAEEDIKGRDVEILYRQALPLQKIYREKVQKYFKKDDRIPL